MKTFGTSAEDGKRIIYRLGLKLSLGKTGLEIVAGPFLSCLYLYHMYILLSLSLSLSSYIDMRAPILSPRLEYGLKYHGKVPVLWEFSFSYKIPFIKLSVENTERITRVFKLKSFLTALSTNTSINYTARVVCPSLREPTRAEWRATNFF